jgi:hypothetical protein
MAGPGLKGACDVSYYGTLQLISCKNKWTGLQWKLLVLQGLEENSYLASLPAVLKGAF